ncbi:MAG: NADH-quinone oxidoreductase subunit M [Acidiferrobacterales bacterium]
MFADNLLSLVIWLPILGGLAVLAIGDDRRAPVIRILSLVISLATFFASILLYTRFDTKTADMQFVELSPWIEAFNVNYSLGIDGISLLLIILTTFTTVLVIIASWKVIQKQVAQYMAMFLIMEGLMVGVFSAMDALLFYVFWEAMLVPMYLIIGIWGGPRRVYAAIKFFLYTFIGSVLMLVSLIYLYYKAGQSFDIQTLYAVKLDLTEQIFIFLALFAAFAVKIPMWPVHTWLPDAHVQAPTGGSVVLAAIMLKLGAYGFLRFNIPIAPDASQELAFFMIVLSLIAVVYIGLVALVQEDMKKLIAYSSISHMGFVTMGLFLFNPQGMEGAIIQMISHGFISGAMFICVGMMYDRMHSRLIKDYGGVVNSMPVFAAFLLLFGMANSGLPATSGFVGEFLVILGAFQVNHWYAAIAALTLIFGAAYTLWMYKRVIFGKVANDKVKALTDINAREIMLLATLAIAVLVMGIWPFPFLEVLHVSVDNILSLASVSKL